MHGKFGQGIPGDVGAHHDDVAKGENQEHNDAVDHAEPQRHQCVDGAGLQSVENLTDNGGEQIHFLLCHPFSWRMDRYGQLRAAPF
jgi:hypothetical protein